MSRIRIKNFGPIREGYLENEGWLDIRKVTVFIGNQGSGKSTVAKVISTLSWLEKAINRGDVDYRKISYQVFWALFKFQRINNYFSDKTEIEYDGDKIKITYRKGLDYPEIEVKISNEYHVPQIMYVPTERNFLSVIENAYGIRNLPDTLYTFAEELRKGLEELKGRLLPLPVGDMNFKYQEETKHSYLVGTDFELDLFESSSGYQSLVPLYLVTKFLSDKLQREKSTLREHLSVEQSLRRNKEIADVMLNETLSLADKNLKVKEIDSRYINTCFINIIEEPEQNLFPISQQKILNSLLGFNNANDGNKLIMTTHSPYLINYLILAVKAGILKDRIQTEELENKLAEIVPLNATIHPDDLIIYELDEKKGLIKNLETYNDLPSDENELNERLGESNELFARLLEIEQKL
ncbi:MAG: AAA family ATPase [Bacteroidia bacterium]|nr:AAA family ATPase [Bacteroidia bacterium]